MLFRSPSLYQQLNQTLHRIADETPNIAIATAEGLTAKADELHFDSPSLRELGHRYYRAYTTIASRR